jgi:hypothetical protein
MTVGPRGTYLNAGLPGTGLSYRTQVAPAFARPVGPAHASEPSSPDYPLAPQPAPGLGTGLRPDAVEIKSAEVSALTSAGLGELKRLINEAAIKRRQLNDAVVEDRKKLEAAKGKLKFAQSFIIRIFTQKSIPALRQATEAARDQLEERTAELEGCVIEVDFAFDDASHGTYAALVRAFEALGSCQRLWDITAVQATDRFHERTVATTSVSRTPVTFDFATPDIVKSSQQALRMGNASGRPIFLYPGFLMMRDGSGDFALIEYRELEANFSQSRFIEEDEVPSDTEVVGQTWKKANKDGSPDRRFKDNYAIPIVRYGETVFRSSTGLFEAYQFSDFGKASTFHQALANHQRALEALGKMGGVAALDEPPVEEEGAPESETAPVPPLALAAPAPQNFALDWAAIVAGVIALGAGANWLVHHPLAAPSAAPPPAVAPTATPTTASAAKVRKHRTKSHHKVVHASDRTEEAADPVVSPPASQAGPVSASDQ